MSTENTEQHTPGPWKTCAKCGLVKALESFYLNPRTKDGRSEKCAQCALEYVKTKYRKDASTPEGKRKQIEKNRANYLKAKESGRAAIYNKKSQYKHFRANKHKYAARCKVARALKAGKLPWFPCFICGDQKSEAHHPDYSAPLAIQWLCKAHHIDAHSCNARKALEDSK